jgi:hypothetical protein
MDEIKAKVLEKIKRDAIDWHRKELSDEGTETRSIDASEGDSAKQELALVRELKKAVVDSSLDRKSIYLTALASLEQALEMGRTPENLPTVVKSLLKKDEIRAKVLELTKVYKISGKSYYYLWGLDDGCATELY